MSGRQTRRARWREERDAVDPAGLELDAENVRQIRRPARHGAVGHRRDQFGTRGAEGIAEVGPRDVGSWPEDRAPGQRAALGGDHGLRERAGPREVRDTAPRERRARAGRPWSPDRPPRRGAASAGPMATGVHAASRQTASTALALVNATQSYSGSRARALASGAGSGAGPWADHRHHPHVDAGLAAAAPPVSVRDRRLR